MKKKKKNELEKPILDQSEKTEIGDAICPTCGKGIDGHRCRLCGAVRTTNSVSGHVIWMRNGRLVCAFKDERDAYARMAERYGIPKSEWPEKFRV